VRALSDSEDDELVTAVLSKKILEKAPNKRTKSACLRPKRRLQYGSNNRRYSKRPTRRRWLNQLLPYCRR
jgi:hypothetical protein